MLLKSGNYFQKYINMNSFFPMYQWENLSCWVQRHLLEFCLTWLFLWKKNARNGGTCCRFGWNKRQLLLIRKIITGWIWMHQSSLLYLLFPNGPFCGTFSNFLLVFQWNEFVVPKVYVFLQCSLNGARLPYFFDWVQIWNSSKARLFWVARIWSNEIIFNCW